jgi:hypothetical protein
MSPGVATCHIDALAFITDSGNDYLGGVTYGLAGEEYFIFRVTLTSNIPTSTITYANSLVVSILPHSTYFKDKDTLYILESDLTTPVELLIICYFATNSYTMT